MNILASLFSFKGRLNRIDYLVNVAIYVGLLVVMIATETKVKEMGDSGSLVTLALVVSMLWIFFASLAKRFHDIGKSRWSTIAVIIPLVGQFIPFILIFYPGDAETNRYG